MSTSYRNEAHTVIRKLHDIGPHKIRIEDLARMIREEGCARSEQELIAVLRSPVTRKNMLTAYGDTKTETRHPVIPVSEDLFREYPEPGSWPPTKSLAKKFMPGVGLVGESVAGFMIPPDGESNPFVQASLDHMGRVRQGVSLSYSRKLKRAESAGQISSNEARVRREKAVQLMSATWASNDHLKQLAAAPSREARTCTQN